MTPLELATLVHTTYKQLAPIFGYQTRPETRIFDPMSPNGRLMVAVCGAIQQHLGLTPHYEVQLRQADGWRRIAVWELDPRRFNRFLSHLYMHLQIHDEMDLNRIRVRRVPYVPGQAGWAYDGTRHFKALRP